MNSNVSASAAGLLFSLGLVVSGMINPTKVLNFLNVTGDWDPSLALVMASAVAVYSIGFIFLGRAQKPMFNERFLIPEDSAIDHRLVTGSIVFGVGWGLVGFCPGPAAAAILIAPITVAPFVVFMIIGVVAGELFKKVDGKFALSIRAEL